MAEKQDVAGRGVRATVILSSYREEGSRHSIMEQRRSETGDLFKVAR